LACQLQAAYVRYIDIRQQQINAVISVLTKSQGLPAIASSKNRIAGGLQYQLDQVEYGWFIIDD
jgi:hypothetical protein